MDDKIAVYTENGFNWALEINGILIKNGFSNPYEAYKFFNFCSNCWYKGVGNV
jgi:hypothetical protein